MPVRKQRAKTGCFSCRQRRVKCDEGRPNCERCRKANILCSGYEAPRTIPLKRSIDLSNGPQLERTVGSSSLSSGRSPDTLIEFEATAFTWTPVSRPELRPPVGDDIGGENVRVGQSRRLHKRAQEALAYQQYTTRTTMALFHRGHLHFWNDYILTKAHELESVFDVVIALGAIHRAVLLMAREETKDLGVETQIMAFEAYGSALKQMHVICQEQNCVDRGLLVAVLLLLTYFETFAGNAASAFRHLRTAHQYLNMEDTIIRYRASLLVCASELSLAAQIVLPLEHFPLYAQTFVPNDTAQHNDFTPPASPANLGNFTGAGLQGIFDFICQNARLSRAVWTPISSTEDKLSVNLILSFQRRLTDLLDNVEEADKHTDITEGALRDKEQQLQDFVERTPQAMTFRSTHAALVSAIFCAYMARTEHMLSQKRPQESSKHERRASFFAYQILRIVEGSVPGTNMQEGAYPVTYTPSDTVRMGFTPLLYLAAVILRNPAHRKWAAHKLRIIKREGLYNSEHFAKALDLIDTFASRCPAAYDNIVSPIIFPDAEDKSLAVYYAHACSSLHISQRQNDGYEVPVELLGRACWTKPDGGATEKLAIEFYDATHPLNSQARVCVYYRISVVEENVVSWRTLFGTPNLLIAGL